MSMNMCPSSYLMDANIPLYETEKLYFEYILNREWICYYYKIPNRLSLIIWEFILEFDVYNNKEN